MTVMLQSGYFVAPNYESMVSILGRINQSGDIILNSGVKSDNIAGNLSALCIPCHAEQPRHQQMKKGIKAEDRRKILDLQFIQNRT